MRTRPQTGARPVTATDIARLLGVSQTTVSRILNNAAGHQYSEEMCRRVQAEAERLGYRPNAVGRSLREGRTHVIGFYSYWELDARNPFLAEIIGSLQRASYEMGYALLLQAFPERTTLAQIVAELTGGRMDGVVVHAELGHPIVEQLHRLRFPAVAVTDAHPQIPSVTCDDRAGIRLALEYLERAGHRGIAFLYPTFSIKSAEDRTDAFREAMAERGREPLMFPIDFEDVSPGLEWLRDHPARPTAVVCWNDLTASNLLYACRLRGIRVPEELAVVGFDGILDIRFTSMALTTIDARWSAVTKEALAVLLKRIAGEDVPPLTVVPVALRAGETA